VAIADSALKFEINNQKDDIINDNHTDLNSHNNTDVKDDDNHVIQRVEPSGGQDKVNIA
jgi:hypothetical protein